MFVKTGFILFFTILCLSIRGFNGVFVEVGDYNEKGVNEWECGLSYVPQTLVVQNSKIECFGNTYDNRTYKMVLQRRPKEHMLTLTSRIYTPDKEDYALREDAPWTVFIDTTTHHFNCTGVLITSQWVLTHPECLINSKEVVIIVTNHRIHNLYIVKVSAADMTHNRYVNPDYRNYSSGVETHRKARRHGVALLKLPKTAGKDVLSRQSTHKDEFFDINNICLPSKTDRNRHKEAARFTGWGRISNKYPYAQKLKKMPVFLETHEVCDETNVNQTNGEPKPIPQMLCSIHKKGDPHPCSGDWGGPLFQYSDKQGSRGILIGIYEYQSESGCPSDSNELHFWVPILRDNIDFILKTIANNS